MLTIELHDAKLIANADRDGLNLVVRPCYAPEVGPSLSGLPVEDIALLPTDGTAIIVTLIDLLESPPEGSTCRLLETTVDGGPDDISPEARLIGADETLEALTDLGDHLRSDLFEL